MPDIRSGQIYAFYLFDVAETASLGAIPELIGGPAVPARFVPKSPMPAYVQYDRPPISFDGELIGIPDIAGFRPRFRVYDYGIVSLALSQAYDDGSWEGLVLLGQNLIENEELGRLAEAQCRAVVTRLAPALSGLRQELLSEDYLVFAIHEFDRPQNADEIVHNHGDAIAAMLRGERQRLSRQEIDTVLTHRISYLADDLAIATWNAAFVYDTPAGAAATLEIIEFANSQLLEFRYYDQLLDQQLGVIYNALQRPRWYDKWIGSRYTRAARLVHSLFIDVNELTDHTENALKFIGDIYAVRLFELVGDRLGLDRWKANVQAKLKTLDEIYGSTVEQSSISRGHFLELVVVLILVLELVLLLLGIMT
jgi:hypothetical protein